jgi:hypothetical protein
MGDRKQPTPPPPEPIPRRKQLNDLKLLGLKVRDRVTGLTGVCSSVCYDLYGCIQAAICQPVDDKGGLPEGRWFDVARLEILDETPVMEIVGGRFSVERAQEPTRPTQAHGPADKPAPR